MAASFLCRRLASHLLQNPKNSLPLAVLSHHFSTLSASNPVTNLRSQSLLQQIQPRPAIPGFPTSVSRHFCSTPTPTSDTPPEFRHQEIVGPTVDRGLAYRTREAMDAISFFSSALALGGCAQLGFGAYIAYTAPPGSEAVSVHGLIVFAFPFSMAFLMRRVLKPMGFLSKMAEQGLLPTHVLQFSKNLNLFIIRTWVALIGWLVGGCLVWFSAGSTVTICWR